MMQQLLMTIGGSASASGPLHADDVFSTYLYDATGNNLTVNNGIDLSGEGGLIWTKWRKDGAYTVESHALLDTETGFTKLIRADDPAQASNVSSYFTATSNGYEITTPSSLVNHTSGGRYCSWTFRKAPGFFDIVNYTSQSGVTAIDHNLGSVPGCIMVKKLNGGTSWQVYHRYTGAGNEFELDGQDPTRTNGAFPTAPTDTQFFISASDNNVFGSVGDQFVAYIFAHDESTFGLNSDKPIIKCGDFTSNGSSIGTLDIGFEPQWLLVKQYSGGGGSWYIFDQMRGFHTTSVGNTGADINVLRAEDNAGEIDYNYLFLNTNGFAWDGANIGGHSFIYVAIGRLPKPPTSAADVFKVYAQTTGTAAQGDVDYGITADLVLFKKYNSNSNNNLPIWVDRVRGENYRLDSTSSSPQYTDNGAVDFDRQHGITINSDASNLYSGSFSYRHYVWKRAAKFCDIVTWLGSGSTTTIPHNLQIKPEMIIVKNLTYSSGVNWIVWHDNIGDTLLNLNNSDAWINGGPSSTYGGSGAGTATGAEFIANSTDSVIGVNSAFPVNGSGHRYIAYLFASTPGVSKVGSYNGQQGPNVTFSVGLGFIPKFVMIKAADRAGDWNVFDVERGLTVGGTSAEAVALNTTDNETQTGETGSISVHVGSSTPHDGFTVHTSTAGTDINESGKKYIYYAIA
jgi:hypothetical protein